MKKILIITILFTLLKANSFTNLYDALFFSIGKSKDDINIYRIGFRKDFSIFAKNSIIKIGGYWEGNLNYWTKGNSKNYGIALSPVFALYLNIKEFEPYIESGIGISLYTKTHIASRDISSHFLFEDRVGAGVRYKNIDLSFRYMHYSNAGLVKPNQGIDIFIASISYKF